MKNYANEEVGFTGCPGCAYAKHEFVLPCGMAYQNNNFTVSQDWELPIVGFYVVCPTMRHVEYLTELTDEERNELFTLVNETIKILKENNVCNCFNIVIQEKSGVHLHIWIYPQHNWIKENFGNSMAHILDVFNYSKQNFRTEETYNKIKQLNDIVSKALNQKILRK